MKTCKYIGLAGFAFLSLSSLLVAKSAMAIEKAKYTLETLPIFYYFKRMILLISNSFSR